MKIALQRRKNSGKSKILPTPKAKGHCTPTFGSFQNFQGNHPTFARFPDILQPSIC